MARARRRRPGRRARRRSAPETALSAQAALPRALDEELLCPYLLCQAVARRLGESAFAIVTGGEPEIMAGAEHLQGLLEWLRERPVETGRVGRADVELVQTSDDASEVWALVEAGGRRQLAILASAASDGR